MERIGVFGGTFDPPHVGHLALAEWATERLRLDRVVFVPAGSPPHKRGARLSSAAARLAMTRLAVRGNRRFVVSTLEVRSPGPSYTVETLRRLRARRPRGRWFLLIGSDSLDEFHTWREPDSILALATVVVAARPSHGTGAPARSETLETPVRRHGWRRASKERAFDRMSKAMRVSRRVGAPVPWRDQLAWLGNPGIEVSSTMIRARAKAGRSVRYLVPDAVATYIARHRLYRRAGRS